MSVDAPVHIGSGGVSGITARGVLHTIRQERLWRRRETTCVCCGRDPEKRSRICRHASGEQRVHIMIGNMNSHFKNLEEV